METARKFEDLVAWQLCSKLRDLVFELTDSGRCVSDAEFRDQIRRASKSAPRLIAEGFLRFTADEFVRYLRMARSEIGEVQNELDYERSRRYFTDEQSAEACTLARRAMTVTSRLLKSKLPLLKPQRARTKRPSADRRRQR